MARVGGQTDINVPCATAPEPTHPIEPSPQPDCRLYATGGEPAGISSRPVHAITSLLVMVSGAVLMPVRVVATGAAPSSPLAPLETFFAEPSRFAEHISPDGKRVAYLGPDTQGTVRLWVANADHPGNTTRASAPDGPGVAVYFWIGDSLFWQTRQPDGRARIFLGTPQAACAREILPDEKRFISLERAWRVTQTRAYCSGCPNVL